MPNMAGYSAVPRAHLYDERWTANDKLTYIALAAFVGADKKCWPHLDTIVRLASISQSSVQRSLRHLRKLGVVTWVRTRDKDGFYNGTIYTLDPPVVTVTSSES